MPLKTLTEKLKLKPGISVAVLHAPEGYLDELSPLPDGVVLSTELSGNYDWIQLFVKDRHELERTVAQAIAALSPESLLWISFPKGSSRIQTDLTRDQGWDYLASFDLKWINLVSVNGTWSAFCLRPYRPKEPRQSFR